jgi:ELWxxDGT repeat protein
MENLKGLGQLAYFTAETDSFGNELWVSDGTEEGTFMLLDMLPGEEDGMYKYDEVTYGNIGNTLFFTGTDTIHGRELWLTEGTRESTQLVKDLSTQTGDIILRQELQGYKGSMYFATNYGLWKTDGTPESTSLVKPFEYCTGLNLFNGLLYFTARDSVVSTVWTSDGTTEGTKPFLSQVINDNHSVHLRENMPQVNGYMFMTVRDSLGEELWKTDGTVEGTQRVKDIYEGQYDGTSSLSMYAVLNDVLYFTGNDGIIGWELWRSDGTEEGTYAVYDINPFGHSYCRNFITMGDAVYFSATKDDLGYELWKTDGTNAGTKLVKDIRQGEGDGYRFGETAAFNNTIYFNANDGIHGEELWKSDGTEEGTIMVQNIGFSSTSNFFSGDPESYSIINNQLYFRARDTIGYRIYTTDGTEEGTYPVLEDVVTDRLTSIIQADDKIFFTATTDEYGTELWWADTNFTNASMVKDIHSGGFSSRPIIEGFKNGTLYFRATEDKYGKELYALSPLDLDINIQNLTETSCSSMDTITLQATINHNDAVESYQWYVNDNLIATSASATFQKAGFEDADEIQVKTSASKDYWVKNKTVSSNLLTIRYEVPQAELSLSEKTLTATGGESFKWFLDNEPLEYTGQSLTVEQNGTYQVEVTNRFGCTALSNPLAVVFETVGLTNLSANSRFSFYPNPSSGYVRINTTANEDREEYRVNVINAAGVVVSENTVTELDNQVFIGEKSGIYLLQMIDKQGIQVASFKVLVK